MRALGTNSKTPTTQGIQHWQEALSWYQKSQDVWERWNQLAVSSVFNEQRSNQAFQNIALCAGQIHVVKQPGSSGLVMAST
jgi:hypothetical protein